MNVRHRLWLTLGLLVSVAALAQEPLLPAVTTHVQREFERVGRAIPQRDPILEKAAEALARTGLEQGAARAADAVTVAREVSRCGGFDPNPRTLVIRASPPERALESLKARTDLSEEPATHFGVAVVQRGEEAVLVVVLAERKAQLEPFSHQIAEAGVAKSLCGALRSPLERGEVYVTRPSGTVDKIPLTKSEAASFCSTLTFPTPGEHSVEVIGHGPAGPEVAALFYVEVGAAPERDDLGPTAEPTTVTEARQVLADRINHLRAANGAAPLTLNETLNAVAQTYSEKMAKEHFFAHVAPDGATLTLRLRRSGFSYRRAGENLGLASGPLAAHYGIEQSPGHRRNLLEPEFELLGLGVATEQISGRSQVVVTEVLAAPTRIAEDAVTAVHRALARRRAQLKLPALERTSILDSLALDRAREALARGVPEVEPANSPLQQKVFAALSDAQSTSVDLFVADQPTFVPESQSMRRAGNTRVGVGAVKGRTEGDEHDKYWVIVIYAGKK